MKKTVQEKIHRLYFLRLELEKNFSKSLLKEYSSKRLSEVRYSYDFQKKYPPFLKKLHSQIRRLQKLHNALYDSQRIYK